MKMTISALIVAMASSISMKIQSLRKAAARGDSVPFEGALAPHVEQSEPEDRDEHQHLVEPGPPQAAKRDSPGIKKNHLDVEDDEQNRRHVEFHRETAPRRPGRRIAALERLR